jgi:uncharacterized tellurite resistance protein B-like protein
MNERVAYCHLVARVLAADGIMEEAERSFLEKAMAALGLDAAERDAVVHFEGAAGAEDAMRALPEERRRALVEDLVDAAFADGKLSRHESAIVKAITSALGL